MSTLTKVFGIPFQQKDLFIQLAKRDILGRYRGSTMGLIWSILTPLLLLGIYTFVFKIIFGVRWGAQEETTFDFVQALFIGMVVHGLFAECLTRAPFLITTNVNYVKKVVFPLELFSYVTVSTALFHSVISFLIVICIAKLARPDSFASLLLLPLVLGPLLLICLGITWIFSATSVYIRDITHVTPFLSTALLFTAPVFYPISSVPPEYQPLIYINPLTFFIDQARAVILMAGEIHWRGIAIAYLVAWLFAWASLRTFLKARRGFNDVL